MRVDLARLDVPGPIVTALTEPFWTAVGAGRLLIQRCGACARPAFYPRARCPHCWADAMAWEEASGDGRLSTFTEIWKPGHPGWKAAAPYRVGLVALAEGPVMLSHILTAGQDLAVGIPMRFAATEIGARVLPCFTPAGEQGGHDAGHTEG